MFGKIYFVLKVQNSDKINYKILDPLKICNFTQQKART